MYQDLHNKAKKIIKKDACKKIYDTSIPLYLEPDASGLGLGAWLLHIRDDMNCMHDAVPDNATLHPTAFTSKTYRVLSGDTAI